MKKGLLVLNLIIIMLAFSACGNNVTADVTETADKDTTGTMADAAKRLGELDSLQMANNSQAVDEAGYIQGASDEDMQSLYREKGGEIVLLTDNSDVMDGSYQQAIYEGIRAYAYSADNTYSYYNPASGEDEDLIKCMDEAIACGAKLIVCGGWDYDIIVGRYQYKYPDIDFLIVDGVPENDNEEPIDINDNVHCVYCDCTTAGYLAGYLSVLEGYRKFGFIGGDEVIGVVNYGHGFAEGIEDAGKKLGCSDEVALNYTYSGTWFPSDEIYKMSCDWYDAGTEVIFSCGGGIYESVLKATEEKTAHMIGVDVNQNAISDSIITSAINGVSVCVINALDEYFANGGWPQELAGAVKKYEPADKCANLPIDKDSWRFKNVTIEDYFDIYTKITGGELKVEETEELPKVSYALNLIDMAGGTQ